MDVSLAILRGCQKQKDIKVDSLPYVIGRCRTANFIIAHVNVSRNHCHIVRENFLWKVNDYSSSGTYVNDKLIGKRQSRILNSGDVIRFGPIESNLCWTFYPLNELVSVSEQCDGLLWTNAINDCIKDKDTNNKIFHLGTNCEEAKINIMHQELSKESELRISTISDCSSLCREIKESGCEKIITHSKKYEDEIIDCKLHESKCIKPSKRFHINKYEDIEFQLNSVMTEEKVKSKANICKNQTIVNDKTKSLQKNDLQDNSFVPEANENEKNETKIFLKKLNVMERPSKTLPQNSVEVYGIQGPCFNDNKLEKDMANNLLDQKYLYLYKKARIETETDVKRDMEHIRLKKTEELMKELEQLKSALNNLEHKNCALEGELAAASNSKNEALRLKSSLIENLADVMEDELQCTICSELFVQAITLSCSHTFCKFCISQWRKKQKTCPICRKKITSETRSLVVDNYIDKMVGNLSLELKERRENIIAERNESVHQRKVKLQKAKAANFT